MDSFQKAKFIVELAQDKKAQQILVMDMKNAIAITDYFIICSGGSTRHVKTVADTIVENMKKSGFHVWHIEGYEEGRWILLDYGDAIVHIFDEEVRKFYELERLWRDAPIEEIPEMTDAPGSEDIFHLIGEGHAYEYDSSGIYDQM